LSVNQLSGTTPANVEVRLDTAGLAPGSYNTGRIAITRSAGQQDPILIPVTLVVTQPAPSVEITAVSNAASFASGIAPGAWITISGRNLSGTSRTWRADEIVNGKLPTALDGVSVAINGVPAAVHYISPGQINILAPQEGTTATAEVMSVIEVRTPAGTSRFRTIRRPVAPALFMVGMHPAAMHADGVLVAATGAVPGVATRPAKPGDSIALYATGLGQTSPAYRSGELVPVPLPLAAPLAATVGGVAGRVHFAGLVSPGLYQVNIEVPDLPNGSHALVLQVSGASSQAAVRLTVQR